MAQADAPLSVSYPADATTTVPTTHAPIIILQRKMRWADPGGDMAMPRTVSIMTSRMVLSIFNIPLLGAMSPIARLPRRHKIVKFVSASLACGRSQYTRHSAARPAQQPAVPGGARLNFA